MFQERVWNLIKKIPKGKVTTSSSGRIGWYSRGVKNKLQLLENEGIKIKNNRIVDFEKVLFRF